MSGYTVSSGRMTGAWCLSESHYNKFPSRICLYRLGKQHEKKKKVRVVCILAEIKTGRLSNTFQTEITPWSPKSGILTQLCHCTSANKHGPGHWTGEGLKLWLCQSANIRVTDHGPYEQHATWTTWHEELQTKLCLKFRYPQRGMEITGKQIRHTQWRMEFILNFGNNKGKFPFVYHLNF